ncbi:MAG TPA: polyphosphate polymerase domain-containing protein [Clostridium sp.]
MAIEVFNRHETKFLIDGDIYTEIQDRLLEHMELDEYNKTHEFYTISNIYYDTKDNTLIRKSLSKPKYKEKLRLRGYGSPSQDSKVYLEIKKKHCGQVNKRRITLELGEAYEFLSKGIKPVAEDYMKKQITNEIEYILELYNLEPKVYVSYERKALFCKKDHNVRITFDTNIRTRRNDLRLESGNHGEALLDEGQWIMEIKTGKSMPIWLTSLLSEKKIYKNNFSKYGKEYEKLLIENNKLKGEKKLCLNQFSLQPQMLQL